MEIINLGGLKCDNPNCDFKDETISYLDYYLYLNKPCPKCGSNLLTEEYFISFNNLLINIEKAKLLEEELKNKNLINKEEQYKISIDFNGTGKLKYKIEKEY